MSLKEQHLSTQRIYCLFFVAQIRVARGTIDVVRDAIRVVRDGGGLPLSSTVMLKLILDFIMTNGNVN